jgi:F-type H+-transporting ATPase subunit b
MPEPTTHTEVPKGHGVFPPFDKSTFPSQLFWLSVTFVLLYLLMARVALPRIASILGERRKHVDDHLAEAQRLKEQSDAARLASFCRKMPKVNCAIQVVPTNWA